MQNTVMLHKFQNLKELKVQNDSLAMGSPLGPVLSNIFMIELETFPLPDVTDYMQIWKRYVDHTTCFIKI